MDQYVITSIYRGFDTAERISAHSVLEAISTFYSTYGYHKIIKIELTK